MKISIFPLGCPKSYYCNICSFCRSSYIFYVRAYFDINIQKVCDKKIVTANKETISLWLINEVELL